MLVSPDSKLLDGDYDMNIKIPFCWVYIRKASSGDYNSEFSKQIAANTT